MKTYLQQYLQLLPVAAVTFALWKKIQSEQLCSSSSLLGRGFLMSIIMTSDASGINRRMCTVALWGRSLLLCTAS
ncbi:hypothetical protein CY34DRAFT_804592 [Suillus luteus UH-Slu-Lm8-n1]|uniref:Uncharacterized protein n=1 Tax=Suillus luteus UH-Slu-Lm8-n1 TaxID=930992 RepID=A0A0D0BHV7_9AGAM|nr:hypothetical protein CY34DRAFT_804592 [Suillus luteus UH-Slu-Lm8-n1]